MRHMQIESVESSLPTQNKKEAHDLVPLVTISLLQAVLPGPSSQASLASMACGGDALAADERAPGALAIWWLDGDSQVLDYDVTHV